MIYINITNFVLISELEKDYNVTETSRLKNVVIFCQKIVIGQRDVKTSFKSFQIFPKKW